MAYFKLGDGIMEISKETFSKMNTDSKLDVIFDIQIASDAKIESIHDCVKGNGDAGLQEEVAKVKTSLRWTQRFLFILASILGFK